MKFGLLTHTTENLGDDIQALAAAQFLPRIDVHIDRENLRAHAGQGETFLILAGWFKHRPDDWPPPPNIRPLFVGFHVAAPALFDARHLDYYRRHGPVGCRDTATADAFRQLGVEAYYSGCLTLTLRETYLHTGERDGRTHLVDVGPVGPANVKVCRHTHTDGAPGRSADRRLADARWRVRQYAAADMVVTSRLHCLLPCLSLRTPVVHIGPRDGRYSGLDPAGVDELAARLAGTVRDAVRAAGG
jgi:hypothetical protein